MSGLAAIILSECSTMALRELAPLSAIAGWVMLIAGSATVVSAAESVANPDYQLPPEVTPAIRAACETDVRRLCIGQDPSVEKVKSCVMSKFFKLNKQCQVRLMAAGLSP